MKKRSLLQKILILGVVIFLFCSFLGHWSEARLRHKGSLAIVHVSGPIHLDMDGPGWGNPDAEDIARRLHKLSEDKDVKAIVLRINSPGGTVGAVQEIDREMARCREKGKLIIASLGDVAASGGYYLAAGSDKIVANPGTITGSIGVILEFGNLEGLFQKVGLKLEVIKSGAHKDIGSPGRALTAEEKAMLQDSINDAYAQFFDAVSKGRRLDPEKLKGLADGRIFTGRQAVSAGLVDEMGDFEDAIQTAITLAKLPAKPYIDSDEHRSLSAVLQKTVAQFSRQPLDSLQNAIAGASMEYRWRQ
jgi:protease-4